MQRIHPDEKVGPKALSDREHQSCDSESGSAITVEEERAKKTALLAAREKTGDTSLNRSSFPDGPHEWSI